MMVRAVLDTNVLISGAFFAGIPSKILDACMEGSFQPLVSPEILEEYRRVGEGFSGRRPNLDFERFLGLFVARAAVVFQTFAGIQTMTSSSPAPLKAELSPLSAATRIFLRFQRMWASKS